MLVLFLKDIICIWETAKVTGGAEDPCGKANGGMEPRDHGAQLRELRKQGLAMARAHRGKQIWTEIIVCVLGV